MCLDLFLYVPRKRMCLVCTHHVKFSACVSPESKAMLMKERIGMVPGANSSSCR